MNSQTPINCEFWVSWLLSSKFRSQSQTCSFSKLPFSSAIVLWVFILHQCSLPYEVYIRVCWTHFKFNANFCPIFVLCGASAITHIEVTFQCLKYVFSQLFFTRSIHLFYFVPTYKYNRWDVYKSFCAGYTVWIICLGALRARQSSPYSVRTHTMEWAGMEREYMRNRS